MGQQSIDYFRLYVIPTTYERRIFLSSCQFQSIGFFEKNCKNDQLEKQGNLLKLIWLTHHDYALNSETLTTWELTECLKTHALTQLFFTLKMIFSCIF